MRKFEHANSLVTAADGRTYEFTAHNIRLDDGTVTVPAYPETVAEYPYFLGARKLLDALYPGSKSGVRVADLGCLEGGHAVEFARVGYDVLGVEVRDSNFAVCEFVKSRVDLPNLRFVQDNAWNIANHGKFDVMYCSGLLYHMDRPLEFLKLLSSVTRRVAIFQTHFSKNPVSECVWNEGLAGIWIDEFTDDADFATRDDEKWSSWDNRRSFFLKREYLLQAIREAGFDIVLEQYDDWPPGTADYHLNGYYATHNWGKFVGIKA